MEEEIDDELERIVEVAEKLPERYREKCFELLLRAFLKAKASGWKTRSKEHEEGRKRPLAIQEFANQFGASGGVDNAVLAAYWLEEHQGKGEGYESSEIVECFSELRLNYRNPHDPISKAKKKGYLMDHNSKLLLTQTGLSYARSKLENEESE